MEWKNLSDEGQLAEIKKESFETPIAIFKHSTRCSISEIAKSRLERAAAPTGISFYYLDLLNNRHLSNTLAEVFAVHHESPQVLLIRNGECVYDESHNGIEMGSILEQAGLPA
jgi:bacillithiol system protein YtxJ